MNTDLYEKFITDLFDHDESKGDWRFDIEIDKDISENDEEVVALIIYLFQHYREDVDKYSDWQIATGLSYIFNSCFSYAYTIRDGNAPLSDKLSAVRAIKLLYQHCFEQRCSPTLGHLDERWNSLNNLCYMLWDETPLSYCENMPQKKHFYESVSEVMEYSLSLNNIACIESGLHGLGHLVMYFPEAADSIQNFIDTAKNIDPRLIRYVLQAKTGCIQ